MKTFKRTFAAVALLLIFTATSFAQQTQKNVRSIFTATFTSASATPYTANDSVGVAQVLTNAAAMGQIVKLSGVTIRDSAGQDAHLKILFFDGNAPSLTDNAAFAFGSSFANCIGILDIDPADYTLLDSKGIVSRSLLDVWMKLSGTSQNISVACVTTGTPTYGVSGTVTVNFTFEY
jgi:hypothetical protein